MSKEGMSKRQLRREQTVLHADVVSPSLQFAGEVAFAFRNSGQNFGQMHAGAALRCVNQFLQERHRARRQDVHAKKAQVVTCAQSGHDEFLFRDCRRRFLNDVVNLIQAQPAGQPPRSDCAVVGQLAFVRRLHG